MTSNKSTAIENGYGPQCKSDSELTQRYRLLQSWYRVEVLKHRECGLHRPGGRRVGSALVNGEATGANFLSLAATACAWEKLAEKEMLNGDLTVDRCRLFNNMLSSQPMCFNLFADLRLGVQHADPNARQVVAAMFGEPATTTVECVEIEMLPRPKGDYINDKTAFDAAVFFSDRHGRKGLISIETKYTDKLGSNPAANEKWQKELAGKLGLFNDQGQDWYASHHFDQIARNLLLTVAYGRRHKFSSFKNCVLAPADDKETRVLIDTMRQRLAPEYQHTIAFLTLQEVVQCGSDAAGKFFKRHLRRFQGRYLDLSQIQGLLCSR